MSLLTDSRSRWVLGMPVRKYLWLLARTPII
jgi:lipocalin